MDDLARFCCQNPDCSLYGLRGAANLSVCGHLGRTRFSERKGTAFYRCRLPDTTAVSVLDHLAEGNGIRQTSRLVGVHRDTVVRLARMAGQHAHDAHDELVAFSPSDPRGPVRREMVLRWEEAEELRPHRPGR